MSNNNISIIEGKLIYLKPITEVFEKELLLKWRNKDHIRLNMYNSDIINKKEHYEWLSKIINDNTKRYFINYDIFNKIPIGLSYIFNINYYLNNCEWGFYIGEENYLGKGHAIEMEYLILNHVFEKLSLHRLSCAVLDFNEKVISFHKRFGFIEEGRFREYLFRDGRWVDSILLSIIDREYDIKKNEILSIIDRYALRHKSK